MIPAVSPYGLIQESLWPDEWMILVSCMMLNCTTRKQVEKILPTFMQRWPKPDLFVNCDIDELKNLIRPLGFSNRRSNALKEMSKAYLAKKWSHANELPGIGVYAARAWEIFCRGIVGDTPPQDHALVQYYHWRKLNEKNI